MDWKQIGKTVGNTALKVAPAVGNALSGLIGKIGSSKNSARAAEQQYKYNLALQQQAQQWNEYMYKNRYQFQVQDLEAAGINKLYGLGSAPSITSGQGSVGMPDAVNETNGRLQQFLTGVSLAQDWSAKKVQMDKTRQETETEKFNTQLKSLEVIGKNIDNMYAKKNLSAFDKRLKAELEEARSRIIANISGAEQSRAGAVKNMAEAGTARKMQGKITEETQSIKNANVISGLTAEYYKKHPILAGIAIGGRELKDAADIGTNVWGKINESLRNNTARKNTTTKEKARKNKK